MHRSAAVHMRAVWIIKVKVKVSDADELNLVMDDKYSKFSEEKDGNH
jgi:hypothetical protein